MRNVRPGNRLILASASPRRKFLLKQHHIPFKAVPSGLKEPPAGKTPAAVYTKKLALAKARKVALRLKDGLVLGADTVVILRGAIYGKPAGYTDACRILRSLQGTTHRVITGIALVDASSGKKRVAHAVSTVTMRPISEQEIRRYAGRHQDKAGSYAVQERKDSVVLKIEGSYSNVVGLPMELLKKMLREFGG